MAGADTLPFLGFIVNPDSFSQTVENLFYFAFLIKEGKAAIEMDEDPESPYFGDAVTCTSFVFFSPRVLELTDCAQSYVKLRRK